MIFGILKIDHASNLKKSNQKYAHGKKLKLDQYKKSKSCVASASTTEPAGLNFFVILDVDSRAKKKYGTLC